ncbi:MAG: hypothetical protein Q8P02_00505, partial [Candidatus Micrarchaeota archaeon]|nr:hypothetical protein [Candidatus Micrarchaeota archaeon]
HARKMDLKLYPLGTYPGEFASVLYKKPRYAMQRAVFGSAFDERVGHIFGFHFHKDLPKGTLDRRTGKLRTLLRSSVGHLLTQQHNFLVAADPALTTLLQSSPFFNGRYVCKDTRIALYRDMDDSRIAVKGLFAHHPRFGRIPHYAHSVADISAAAEYRKKQFVHLVRQKSRALARTQEHEHPYNFYWGPVRVNKIGTFEQRGMDINLPQIVFGVSTLLKRALSGIAAQGIAVVPSAVGEKQPFKLEGNQLHVPPHHHVVRELSIQSATHGLSNVSMYRYTASFVKFARRYLDHKPDWAVQSVLRMLSRRETVSDRVMARAGLFAPKPGFAIDHERAGQIALHYANRFEEQVDELRERYLILADDVSA